MNNVISLLASTETTGATTGNSGSAGQGIIIMIVYVVAIFGFFYFFMIRPQKKQQTQTNNMLAALENGDSVLTTSGFYGVVIDINDDVVIVEFGNNKNCRIPMQKSAIVDVEKAADGLEK
jgi:preprotein translocase subunit YajC